LNKELITQDKKPIKTMTNVLCNDHQLTKKRTPKDAPKHQVKKISMLRFRIPPDAVYKACKPIDED
jgi:hypothetical protein